MDEQVDFLAVLREGLPPSGAAPRKIVIIGAGIAGLCAGSLLKAAGHEVIILEAQNRLGGRILTGRAFAGGMYGELGAMRFPQQHHFASYLIEEKFGLQTRPFPMYDQDTFIYLQGKSVRRSEFTTDIFDFDLPAQEAGLLPDEILKRAVQPLIDLMEREDQDRAWDELVSAYDKYSVLGYLKERGLSDAAIAMIGPLLNLEGRFHFSLVEWFSHYYENVFGDLVYIADGADSLPRAFEPQLMEDIRFGAEVQAIEEAGDQVQVQYAAGRRRLQLSADECIITVPFVLLRHMEITGLDPEKWFAIRNAYYGRAHKIFMQFSERWWENQYDITHGVTVTDLGIRNVVYTPAGQNHQIPKGVLLVSYGWGQDSMAYSPLPEEERVGQALEDLAKIHPEALATFEYGLTKDWALDRYAGGIGPLFRPFEMSGKFYEDLIRPVGRIWFANDACDRRHRRWIEGAIVSATKNAYALHTGMRNRLPWKD
jgi:monoamine oxidase